MNTGSPDIEGNARESNDLAYSRRRLFLGSHTPSAQKEHMASKPSKSAQLKTDHLKACMLPRVNDGLKHNSVEQDGSKGLAVGGTRETLNPETELTRTLRRENVLTSKHGSLVDCVEENRQLFLFESGVLMESASTKTNVDERSNSTTSMPASYMEPAKYKSDDWALVEKASAKARQREKNERFKKMSSTLLCDLVRSRSAVQGEERHSIDHPAHLRN
jgi:hypothetical protein